MNNEAIIKLLNEQVPLDSLGDITPNELSIKLVDLGLIESSADMNLMVIEKLTEILMQDDEVPVHYYSAKEEIPEERKEVKDVECLTDDYIASQM